MRHLSLFVTFVAAAGTLAACANVPATLPDDEAAAYAAEVDEVVENMITGLSGGDYGQHSRDFDETMLEQFDEVVFEQVYDEVIGVTGPYVSRSLNRVEQDSRFTAVVYDAVFENDSAVTMRVVFWRDDPAHLITGLWFDSELLREANQ
jgi:hypothetical protein